MTKGKRGVGISLKKRGVGRKKLAGTASNLVFKSKLMAKQKTFLNQAVENVRIQGTTGSTRTTDRSFHWDAQQKKSLVDLVNGQSCMYCNLEVAACANKTHQQAQCVTEDVERAYQRIIETDAEATERKRLESLAKDATKAQRQIARTRANATLLALERTKYSKIRMMKEVLVRADEWMESVRFSYQH
jgi:hypothetical protein